MAASFLQSTSLDQVSSSTTVSKAYASNCTNGSLLIAVVFWTSGSATCSVSDGTNGSWTAIGSPVQLGSSAIQAQAFYFAGNTSTTTLSVTATISASVSERGIAIHEYSGVNTLETHIESNIASSGTPSQTRTPNSSSDLAFSWVLCAGHVNSGPSGFNLRENTNFAGNGTADDLTPTGGSSLTATWTVSDSTNNVVGLDVFSQVTASGTPTRMLMGVGT